MFDFDNFDLNPQAVEGGGGTEATDYAPLINKPKINGHTLIGDKTFKDLGLDVATTSNAGIVKPDGQTVTITNDGTLSAATSGLVIDIGSLSDTYRGYAIPKIEKSDAISIYEAFSSGKHVALLWTLLNEEYIAVISAGEVLGDFSFDVCVHNQFHINYKWNNSTGTYCDFEVNESSAQREVIQTTGDSGTLTNADMGLVLNDNSNVVIKNDNEYYHLMHDAISYRTFMNTNTPSIEVVTHKAIYVNTTAGAVNYGTWSKEEIGA